jgi:hypothetical protein
VVVYGRVAVRSGPIASVFCGWAVFLLVVGILSPVQPPPALSFGFVAACFPLGAVSGALGSHLSGLLAPFSIVTSILAVFLHAHAGPGEVLVLLRNFLLGFYAFAVFCLVAAVALPTLATAAAYSLATAAALAVQASIFLVRWRRPAGGAGRGSELLEPSLGD